jgi:hypothetical protein
MLYSWRKETIMSKEYVLFAYIGGLALIALGCLLAPKKGSLLALGGGFVLAIFAAL